MEWLPKALLCIPPLFQSRWSTRLMPALQTKPYLAVIWSRYRLPRSMVAFEFSLCSWAESINFQKSTHSLQQKANNRERQNRRVSDCVWLPQSQEGRIRTEGQRLQCKQLWDEERSRAPSQWESHLAVLNWIWRRGTSPLKPNSQTAGVWLQRLSAARLVRAWISEKSLQECREICRPSVVSSELQATANSWIRIIKAPLLDFLASSTLFLTSMPLGRMVRGCSYMQ